jgi:hypothetical protein
MLAWVWLFLSSFIETHSTLITMDEMSPPPGPVPGLVTRAAARERAAPGASTGALAARLLGKLTSPSQAAVRAERKVRLQKILNALPGDTGGQEP